MTAMIEQAPALDNAPPAGRDTWQKAARLRRLGSPPRHAGLAWFAHLACRGARAFLLTVALELTKPLVGQAVLFFATDDPAHNTTPPTGELADSGWQFQGRWLGFLGTPIAPRYFLTARHIGGTVGDGFLYRGVVYRTTAVFDDPESDLRLWRVCGTFPDFAPLYTQGDELNRLVVVFGRGTRRGEAVEVADGAGAVLKGWRWGPADGVQRWGRNVVSAVLDGTSLGPLANGAGATGPLLAMNFDADGVPDECHLSGGDSGGAVFIQDGEAWKLAGINYAVDGPYNTTDSGEGFPAAIFDEGGLYQRRDNGWQRTPELPHPRPGSFYATRLSARLEWIHSVLQAPLPAEPVVVLQAAPTSTGPFTDVPEASLQYLPQRILLPRPVQTTFYRLRSCFGSFLGAVRVEGSQLVVEYTAFE